MHNLRRIDWNQPTGAFDWTRRFDDAATSLRLEQPGDILALVEHQDFELSVPTPDHFIPLLYVAALAAEGGDAVDVLVDVPAYGSLSMTSFALGADCPIPNGNVGAQVSQRVRNTLPRTRDVDNTCSMAEFEEFDPSAYERSAEVYDLMNAARGKSYPDEAATVLRLIRRRVPDARTLLDVACGTGLHLRNFRNGVDVEGVEPHPRLRAIARDRLPDVPLHDGDMRTFELGRQFDVVTCLFSAIGYMLTLDDLHSAIQHMAAHVSPGGVLVVEPWFHPDAWIDGLVIAESANVDDVAIARLSHSSRDGDIAHFDFYWTVARGPTLTEGTVGRAAMSHRNGVDAVTQWTEPHRLGLWTDAEYRDAFAFVGLDVEHDPNGLIGRGLYLGYKSLD